MRLTKPCVAFSIFIHKAADARLSPFISKDSQVGEMLRYSAISALDPLGSSLKYSINVMFIFLCFLCMKVVGHDLVFNSGAKESQKNLRVNILVCWLNTQHG